MVAHFRECLRVHCFFGDIGAEHGLENIWARTEEWSGDGAPHLDRDFIDMAIRKYNEKASNTGSDEDIADVLRTYAQY